MLHRSECIDLINERTIPVLINVTDQGYPNHIPILGRYEAYSANPWPHIKSSHVTVMNANGEQVYSSSGSQILEADSSCGGFSDAQPALYQGLERFDRERELLRRIDAGESSAQAELDALHAEIHAELEWKAIPFRYDIRIMTAHAVVDRGDGKWAQLVQLIIDSEAGRSQIIQPELRRLISFALGEFVVDDSPFADTTEEYLKVMYLSIPLPEAEALYQGVRDRVDAGPEAGRYLRPSDFPIPDSLRLRAAASLIQIHDIACDASANPVEVIRAWWPQQRERFLPHPPVINPQVFARKVRQEGQQEQV